MRSRSDHFDEGRGAGLGFVVATVILVVLAVLGTRTPTQGWLAATGAVFAGLLGSYALVVATGMPVLHPETDAVEALALFTKAVEAIGLVFVMSLRSSP